MRSCSAPVPGRRRWPTPCSPPTRAGRLRLHVRVDERSAGFLALGLARGSGAPVAVVDDVRHGRRQPAPRRARGPPRRYPAGGGHRRPPARAAWHRRQPDHRAARHLRGEHPLRRRPPRAGRPPGARPVLAQHRLPGRSRPRPAPPAASPGRCTSTSACASRWPPSPSPSRAASPTRAAAPASAPRGRTTRWPDALSGRADGEPWVLLDDAGARWPAPAPLAEVARTLVVVGDTRDPALGERAAAWAAERGHPLVAEPFGSAAVAGRGRAPRPAAAHGHRLARRPRPGPRRRGRPADPVARGRRPAAPPRAARRGGVGGRPVARPVARRLRRAPPARPSPRRPHRARRRPRLGRELAQRRADGSRMPLPRSRSRGPVASASPAPSSTGSPATPCSSSARATRCVTSTSPWPGRSPTRCWPTAAWPASTAWSPPRSASRWPERPAPTYALLGDLTFLHDANGLLIGPDEPTPDLTVVVVNDDGGGIFTTLEHGAPERAADFERVFGTPTGTDLGGAVPGTRHPARPACDRRCGPHRGGRRAAARHPRRRGAVDRATHRQAHADLRALAAAALATIAPPAARCTGSGGIRKGKSVCAGSASGMSKDRFRARSPVARMRS